MIEKHLHTCVVCLFPMMRVALDRKGRSYLRCDSCGSILFARCGDIGLGTVLALANRIDSETAVELRTEAMKIAERGSIVQQMAAHAQQNRERVAAASGVADAGKAVA
jgi:hypothetical protein